MQHTLSIALGVAFPAKLSRKYSPALSHCPRLLSSLPSTRAALKVCRAARGRGFLQQGEEHAIFKLTQGVKTSILGARPQWPGNPQRRRGAFLTSRRQALKMVLVSKMCYFAEAKRMEVKRYAPLLVTPTKNNSAKSEKLSKVTWSQLDCGKKCSAFFY